MPDRTVWLKCCFALSAACALASLAVALAFPDSAAPWLSRKGGIGDNAEAQTYYSAINAPATFTAWKAAYGFNGSNDIHATYYNAGDLGFGREMHCRKTGSDTACYVVNHALGAGAPADLSVDAAVANQETLAAVAMVYHGAISGQANAVQFFIYNTLTDQRLNGVALDGQGQKFLPRLCLACHGSTDPVSVTQISQANFLPFDIGSFRYSGQAAFTQVGQADALRQLNAMVRDTQPITAISSLIDGWYAPGDVHNPASTFHEQYVPPAYSGTVTDTALYQGVYRLYCRSCHIAEAFNLANPSDFAAARSDIFNQYVMPHTELTNHNFWSGGAPALLANNRGWSLRVTRTDDPPPDGCLPSDCSLREAIVDANASAAPLPSIITFDVDGVFTLTRAGTDDAALVGDLDVTNTATLLGNGPARTIIDANGVDRVFEIQGGAHVVIQDVTIRGGVADPGGGIYNAGGTLDLNRSVLRNNLSGGNGGGIANDAGATTHILQSTIGPNNSALGSFGGGLYNDGGVVTLESSTLSDNVASLDGGGAANTGAGAAMTITQATITGNIADEALVNDGGARLALGNSLLSGNNVNVADCLFDPSGTYLSLGFNLVGKDGSANGCSPGANDHIVAGSAESVVAINLVSSQSGSLYHPLVPGSPAIDAIPVGANCALPSYDQRNTPRPAIGNSQNTPACDIGAREFVRARVTTNADVVADDGLCSLREAVTAANTGVASGLQEGECPAGADLIELSVAGPYSLTGGQLAVASGFILDGHGQTIRRASGAFRVFEVKPGATLNLLGATVQDGSPTTGPCSVAPCDDLSGGGILIDAAATANILNSAIVNNVTGFSGGGIFNLGSLNLANSTFSGNSAAWHGGGLYNGGTALLTNVTIANNVADAGANGLGHGGGLATLGLTVTTIVNNSLIAGNSDLSSGSSFPDVYFDTPASGPDTFDFNLIGNGTGSNGHFTAGHDQVGTSLAPIDARLGPLTGAPAYRMLLSGSPAIDRIPTPDCLFFGGAGNPLFVSLAPVTTDQRGVARPLDGNGDGTPACDIGAYEALPGIYLPTIMRAP